MLKIKSAYNLLRLAIQYTVGKAKLHPNLGRTATTMKEQEHKIAKAIEKTMPEPAIIADDSRKPTVFKEVYPIQEPYIYAAIVKEPETQKTLYEIIEPTLQKDEEKHLQEIKNLLMEEVDVNLKEIETKEKAEKYLKEKTKDIIKKYRITTPPEAVDKLAYYIVRDFLGYGKIDSLMKDHLIEDISADGANIPIYIWHRIYESLPTNIMFKDEAELDSFIIRLAYLAGKTSR